MVEPNFRDLGPLRGFRPAQNGAVALELAGGRAELSVAPDGALRIRCNPGNTLSTDPLPGIGRAPWPCAKMRSRERDGGVSLIFACQDATPQVDIDADPFRVRLLGRRGATRAELFDFASASGSGMRVAVATTASERFYGFGEKHGGLNKRGSVLEMRNTDPELRRRRDPLYVSIPFFLAQDGFHADAQARGVLLESAAPSRFDVAASKDDRVVLETRAEHLDLAIFPGPHPADVLRRFTARVGRNPLPPLWALGHHQSRWSYASEDEVRKVAREIRRRGIPTDVIHLDIDYMHGFRVFTWDPKRFPDPKGLLRDLALDGFRVVTIVDPGVKFDADYGVYNEGRAFGHFCTRDDERLYTLRVWPREAALPDFNCEEVRSWWGEQHRKLLDAGVSGIWNDMNEPAGWSRDVRLGRVIFPYRGQNTQAMQQASLEDPSRKVRHEMVRNVYGYQECRATREFLEEAYPERRHFLLSRAGFTGIQRYAALWTGDNKSRWSDLRESLPMLLNLSVSGVPFCGADIGGFAFSATPELYARWIQIGSLYPFARTHSMWLGRRQEPWRFGKRVEDIARTSLERRMHLLPYFYRVFREAEFTGAPVWRPLAYEFPEDPECAEIQDQVLLGPNLLLAPVLEKGARKRTVYLPPGVWFDWESDARYAGPRHLVVEAPLEKLPIFVRGGSILPTQSPVRHAKEVPKESLRVEVFPGLDAATELVEDDGETTAYRHGVVATTELRMRARAGGRLRVEIGARKGTHRVPERVVPVIIRGAVWPETVMLDASPIACGEGPSTWSYRNGRLCVRYLDDGGAHSIEIEPAP